MQEFRFPDDDRSPFKGQMIDRNQILQFRLNRRLFHGFAGDTVFSALLANGVSVLDGRDGNRTALNQRTASRIRLLSKSGEEFSQRADELQITDGLELQTSSHSSSRVLNRIFRGTRAKNTLQYAIPTQSDIENHAYSIVWGQDQDIVIIGGGISGLQAAAIAGKTGRNVLLLEKSNRLGGMCDYYGRAEDEEAPKDLITRLRVAISELDNVRIEVSAEVIDVRRNTILVSSSKKDSSGINRREYVKFNFEKLIIAVGANYGDDDNATNDLIGISSAAETFRLAADFAIKPTNGVALITGGNSAYRLAMLLKENGVEIDQLLDKRINPSSRHIDFAKAVGVLMQHGQVPKSISSSRQGLEVDVQEVANGKQKTRGFTSLILSDAPRPNYFLWVRAGGMSTYDHKRKQIQPCGQVQDVEIVGSAKGNITQHECLAEAQNAVARQLGLSQLASEQYSGTNQYESLPETFAGDLRRNPLDTIRTEANVPEFVENVNTDSLSEFQFQNISPNRSIRQTMNIEEEQNEADKQKKMGGTGNTDDLSARLSARFASPHRAMIVARDNIVLQVGQMIYDGDGVDKRPELIGIVARQSGKLCAVLEGSVVDVGQNVFVQSRSGLHSASLGEF